MPCLSFILPLLRALHVAYSSRLFLAERDPVASLGLALSALPRRPCIYPFRLIHIPLSKIYGWPCFKRPMQTLQDASYLGIAASCMHNTFVELSHDACHIAALQFLRRMLALIRRGVCLATTLQGPFSLSLKAVSHTFPLVSSVFFCLLKDFFAFFFLSPSFAFVKGSVSYFPACVKHFFAIAKKFFGKLSRLAFVLFGKGPRGAAGLWELS